MVFAGFLSASVSSKPSSARSFSTLLAQIFEQVHISAQLDLFLAISISWTSFSCRLACARNPSFSFLSTRVYSVCCSNLIVRPSMSVRRLSLSDLILSTAKRAAFTYGPSLSGVQGFSSARPFDVEDFRAFLRSAAARAALSFLELRFQGFSVGPEPLCRVKNIGDRFRDRSRVAFVQLQRC